MPKEQSEIIFCDGSSKPDSWAACCVWKDQDRKIVRKLPTFHTNNQCEYLAVITALDHCKKGATIYTDSQLVVGQACDGWKVNELHLIPLVNAVQDLLVEKNARLLWVRREMNLAGKEFE